MSVLIRWIVVGVYAALVTRLSLAPSSSLKLFSKYIRFAHSDKVVHFAMYGVLAALLVWAFRVRATRVKTALWVAGICVGYGLLMEILQILLLPGDRHFCLVDVTANTAGAVASVLLLSLWAQSHAAERLNGEADRE
ncbi:VanZ family protein [Candidatus Fermentibacteria bacterium]|nr:VanZ family protein [Candidatus Fermentibacteria bacterium]